CRGTNWDARGRSHPDGQEVPRERDNVLSLARGATRYCRSEEVARKPPRTTTGDEGRSPRRREPIASTNVIGIGGFRPPVNENPSSRLPPKTASRPMAQVGHAHYSWSTRYRTKVALICRDKQKLRSSISLKFGF